MGRIVNDLVRRYLKALAAGEVTLAGRLRAQIARETEWGWWERCDDPGEAILEWIDTWGPEMYKMMPRDS